MKNQTKIERGQNGEVVITMTSELHHGVSATRVEMRDTGADPDLLAQQAENLINKKQAEAKPLIQRG